MPTLEVNGKVVNFTICRYNARKSIPFYSNRLRTALNKIGIDDQYIDIRFGGGNGNWSTDGWAEIIWVVNGKEYNYKCSSQGNAVGNVAAIAQMIEQDSKAIRRGMKTFGQVMSQFQLGYDPQGPRTLSPREILGLPADMKDWDYIRFKYHRKAKELHPDSGGDADKFKELQTAFEDLKKEFGK